MYYASINNNCYDLAEPVVQGSALYELAQIDPYNTMLILVGSNRTLSRWHVCDLVIPIGQSDWIDTSCENDFISLPISDVEAYMNLKSRGTASIMGDGNLLHIKAGKYTGYFYKKCMNLLPADNELYINGVQIKNDMSLVTTSGTELYSVPLIVDIEHYAEHSLDVPEADKYRITIDGEQYEIFDAEICRHQVLELAGEPDERDVCKFFTNGEVQLFGSHARVNLRAANIRGFSIKDKKKCTKYEVELLKADEEYLNRYYSGRWETLSDPDVLIIYQFPLPSGYNKDVTDLLLELPLRDEEISTAFGYWFEYDLRINKCPSNFESGLGTKHGELWGFSEWTIDGGHNIEGYLNAIKHALQEQIFW